MNSILLKGYFKRMEWNGNNLYKYFATYQQQLTFNLISHYKLCILRMYKTAVFDYGNIDYIYLVSFNEFVEIKCICIFSYSFNCSISMRTKSLHTNLHRNSLHYFLKFAHRLNAAYYVDVDTMHGK